MSDQAALTNALLREKGVIPAASEASPDSSGASEVPTLPAIRLPGRNIYISDFARELGAVMCTNGVFLRSDVAMTLDKRHGRLERLDADTMITYAEDLAFIHQLEKAGESFVKTKVSMKREMARAVLASPHFRRQQREIWRVNSIPCPVLRENGTLELLKAGTFDQDSGILTLPGEMNYRVMPVDEAVMFLKNLTAGFPMPERDGQGISHALRVFIAALMTPFCLSMMPKEALVPMFIFCSNRQGSGKSLLVKIILYTLFGKAGAISFGKDEEELRKLLDTEALANEPYVFFDNVKRPVSSQQLDMWLTMSSWKGRRMGGQTGFEVEKQGCVFLSSNHAETDKDSNRRSLFCELFIEDADISDRKFSRLIDDSWLNRSDVRQDILSACWSLVVHWDKSGRPKGSRTLGSFERWAELVGGIVEAAGLGDPLARSESITAGDADTKDMRALVRLLALELAEKVEQDRREREAEEEETGAVSASGEDDSAQVAEFDFDRVIEICQAHDLFVKRIDGKKNKDGEFELTRSSRIGVGKLLGREAGQVWNIEEVGKIRFGRRGSKNWRSFIVELVE